ncbi:MAG: FkbM family methyltransferase [Chthoniobacterales bacterium]
MLKSALRKTLAPLGLEVRRANSFGQDPFSDVRRLAADTVATIFDVGANEGQSAMRLREIFPSATLHCFEPGPAAFHILEQNLGRDPRVRLVRKALGDRAGIATLHENESSVTNSLLPNAPGAAFLQPPGKSTPVGHTEVEVTTIDAYCAENQIGQIDLLKIDSQGFELKVLTGAEETLRSCAINFLLLEVLFDELYSGQAFFHEIYDFLSKRHYRFVGLYEISRGTDAHVSWCDALFRRSRDAHR